ncbi:hypothetical protein EYF80_015245 [Liparis tanakae]|uniref:Uncharacterized protein n=1 Tax=Liparis tanakae TaxID=230148 RepID=A0A4Z2IAN0_9TELE|nr:hypothetical protein EYF80_015245 [Liparis tanakae]
MVLFSQRSSSQEQMWRQLGAVPQTVMSPSFKTINSSLASRDSSPWRAYLAKVPQLLSLAVAAVIMGNKKERESVVAASPFAELVVTESPYRPITAPADELTDSLILLPFRSTILASQRSSSRLSTSGMMTWLDEITSFQRSTLESVNARVRYRLSDEEARTVTCVDSVPPPFNHLSSRRQQVQLVIVSIEGPVELQLHLEGLSSADDQLVALIQVGVVLLSVLARLGA